MYFYNIKLLDLKKKEKKKNPLNSSKKKWPIPDIESGTFAPETMHQRLCYEDNYPLVEKFKLFISLFHTVYLVF